MLVLGNEKGEKSVINWLGLINRMHRDNDVNIFTSLYFFSFFLFLNIIIIIDERLFINAWHD